MTPLNYFGKEITLLLLLCSLFLSHSCFGQSQMTVKGKAPLRIETPKNWNKNKAMNDAAVYNSPEHCVIVDYTLNEHATNGPVQRSVDLVQGGSRFISTQEMNDAFSSAQDLAVNLNVQGDALVDLQAELNQLYSEYERVQNKIEASHTTIQHKATVNGNGLGNGRSWYEGSLTIKLLCCDDYLCSSSKLNSHLDQIVRDFADANPGSISNEPSNDEKKVVGANVLIYIGIFLGLVLLGLLVMRKFRPATN